MFWKNHFLDVGMVKSVILLENIKLTRGHLENLCARNGIEIIQYLYHNADHYLPSVHTMDFLTTHDKFEPVLNWMEQTLPEDKIVYPTINFGKYEVVLKLWNKKHLPIIISG